MYPSQRTQDFGAGGSSGTSGCRGCQSRYENHGQVILSTLKFCVEEECSYCLLILQGLLRLIPGIEVRFGHDAVPALKEEVSTIYADPNGSLRGKPRPEKWFSIMNITP